MELGNNMALISNGWFEINYLWKWFCRGRNSIIQADALMMGK
jgi:hypothetical protein